MGCLYKLINNVIVLCGHMIVQEALVLGAKAGLDPIDLVEKLRQGTARPYMGLANDFLAKQWENPTSTVVIAEKDVALALELARDQQVAMPVANAAHQTYLTTLAAGLGELHHFSAQLVLESAAESKFLRSSSRTSDSLDQNRRPLRRRSTRHPPHASSPATTAPVASSAAS